MTDPSTDLALELAVAIRSATLPHLGSPEHRGTHGVAIGGDPTFGIDEVAEDIAQTILEAHDDIAWYTEDKGLTERGTPRRLYVIDPIDGTRPAASGLEAACVSIAVAPFDPDAVLADVDEAVILEIKTGTLYRAKKGRGTRIVAMGESRPPTPSGQRSLDGAFWVYGLRGRPTMPSAVVLEELIDSTGVTSGTFDLGSATFGMMGVVTGRFDAYVDHGQRMIDDVPSTRQLFEAIADGAILNNNPYDVAAAVLICEEAGLGVTDAAGNSIAGKRLVGSGAEYCVSTVVASTPDLHREVIAALDRGIDRLREHMEKV